MPWSIEGPLASKRRFYVLASGINYTPRRGGDEIRRTRGDVLDDLVLAQAEQLCDDGALVEVDKDGQPIDAGLELVDGELREAPDDPATATLDQPPDEEPDLDLSTIGEPDAWRGETDEEG